MNKTPVNISELNISNEEKEILKKVNHIPIHLLFGTYIVDEAFFITNLFSDEEKKAFYSCAIALNKEKK